MQALQWSPCLAHSAIQASQHFTHNAQISSQNCESLAHNLAHKAQISAQSRQAFRHSTMPPMLMHMVVHFSHSTMQAKQASIHSFEFFIVKLFNGFTKVKFRNINKYYLTQFWICFI